MDPVIAISDLNKTYADGFTALKNINLNISKGEIFALLGPNGAGKTTMIGIVCGLVTATNGEVRVGGFDNVKQYRQARSLIGLVPQEISSNAFETVWHTVRFSRGLFGKPRNDAYLEKVLEQLSLLDKKHNPIMTLSGGMKRRLMIAKALAHEPSILFLDEPTAGVDVELRRSMWKQVHELREMGVTIVLTTHYIEEAEEMADRIGIISKGELVLVDEKKDIMKKLGKKQVILDLFEPLKTIPKTVANGNLELASDGYRLIYTYDSITSHHCVAEFLSDLNENGIRFKDLKTKESSLEDIFVELVNQK